MNFDGSRRNREPPGSGFVRTAKRELGKHIALARRQGGNAPVCLARLGSPLAISFPELDRALERVEKHLTAKRLLDEVDGACLDRLDRAGDVSAARDDDHRKPDAARD